jgi:sec-independent protein translocase protein TatC
MKLIDIPGIGKIKAQALEDAGFGTIEELQAANENDLSVVSGIGEDLASRIKDAVQDVAQGDITRGKFIGEEKGPKGDRELPIVDHIGELIKRLAVVMGVAALVSVITFPFADTVINFLWDSILPVSEVTRPRLYGILELKFTEFKVASLVGLIIALPIGVWQTYEFMRPGLYEHERRYYLAAIPTSLVLALVGVSFAYFIILPFIFTYFLYYSEGIATIGFGLGQTFNLILVLMGYLAIVFQIPIFVMLALLMRIVTRKWLVKRRILFWGGFLGLSFIFSPDPTGMAPLIVALTMVGLFEGTLLIAKWAGKE